MWESWPSSVSGQSSGQRTDDRRLFWCPHSGSSGALLLTVVQTRTNLVKLIPTHTPMFKSLHRRFFRCHLGFAGLLIQFHLFLRGPHSSVVRLFSLLQIKTAAAAASAEPLLRRARTHARRPLRRAHAPEQPCSPRAAAVICTATRRRRQRASSSPHARSLVCFSLLHAWTQARAPTLSISNSCALEVFDKLSQERFLSISTRICL